MSSLKTTGQRDNQRQRLYDAERDFAAGQSAAGRRLLYGGKKVPSTGSVAIEACQAYVDHVTTAAWFQTRWGYRPYRVRHKAHGSATHGTHISLPPWARTEWVILHEIAHGLTPGGCAWHGPEFAGIFLTLVRYQLGADAAKSLREAFKKHRVRYNLKAVPAAKSHPVRKREEIKTPSVRAKQRAAEERRLAKHAAADSHRRLVGYSARQQAAATLRALIKEGHFGPAGSASRKAALATAKGLETTPQSALDRLAARGASS